MKAKGMEAVIGATRAGLVVVLLISCTGCPPPENDAFTAATATMDKMASVEAEYGTMGISSPVLALPDQQFAFNLGADANQFFADAKSSRQGAVSELQQSILSVGAGLSATFNPNTVQRMFQKIEPPAMMVLS